MTRPISEIIGYQLVGGTEGIHPEMAGSFCVYSLMQVQQMILHTKPEENNYEILRIYSGDIENPTMMFKGSPFTSDKYCVTVTEEI